MVQKPEEATTSSKKGGDKQGIFGNPADFPAENSLRIDSDVDLGDIQISLSEDKDVKKIEESAEGIRKWVQTYLAKLDELYAAPKAVRIRSENKDAVKKIKEKIDSFMNHQEAAYRQAAWSAFLNHKIRHAPVENYSETIGWLSKMVEDGYLENGDYRAPLQAWEKYFRIPEIACFTRPEFEEIKGAMAELVKKVNQATAKERQGRANKLQGKANLQPAETFVKGKEGESFIFVPPQISEKDGRVSIRRGGFLFVGIENGRIYPLEGVGSFEDDIAIAHDFGVFVKAQTLDWDWPPSKKSLFEAGFSENQAKSLSFCWHLLKRAKSLLEQTNQHEEEKIEFSKEVSISEEDFFLENREGCALVNFEGAWEIWTPDKTDASGKKQRKREIYPLFLLVKREGENVSIDLCPSHLEEFFSGCMEVYDQGQKFLGVPQPLQSVLQAQYGAMQTKNLLCS